MSAIEDEGLDLEKETIITPPKKNDEGDIFSPIHEPRTDRDYAKGEVIENVADGQDINIPEPDFHPEPVSFGGGDEDSVHFEDLPNTEKAGRKKKVVHPEDDFSYNTKMENLSKKEKKEAAEMAAEAVVDFYLEYKPKLFRFIGQVPKKKVDKLVHEGKLDMNVAIDFGEMGVHTMREVVEKINTDVESTFIPDPEFKERVVPALTRIFIKRDIGLTDEQYVLIEFGKDIVSSVAELIQIKSYTKSLLEYACDINLQKQQWIREQQMQQNTHSPEVKQPVSKQPSTEPEKELKKEKHSDSEFTVEVVSTEIKEDPTQEQKSEPEIQVVDEGDVKIQ